jgi:hypothetical protein
MEVNPAVITAAIASIACLFVVGARKPSSAERAGFEAGLR